MKSVLASYPTAAAGHSYVRLLRTEEANYLKHYKDALFKNLKAKERVLTLAMDA